MVLHQFGSGLTWQSKNTTMSPVAASPPSFLVRINPWVFWWRINFTRSASLSGRSGSRGCRLPSSTTMISWRTSRGVNSNTLRAVFTMSSPSSAQGSTTEKVLSGRLKEPPCVVTRFPMNSSLLVRSTDATGFPAGMAAGGCSLRSEIAAALTGGTSSSRMEVAAASTAGNAWPSRSLPTCITPPALSLRTGNSESGDHKSTGTLAM
mmetsp:Transcript_49893/g.106828  ORF Transcript_49893/g.106828 Transcript_49893/m.106828 type:complete len:207 (+) Transcript_49893:1558-2178(+)